MADQNHFDDVLIGAGQANMPLVGKLAEEGRRVAVIERAHLGGSCVNFGCTPTKGALAAARVAHLARTSGDLGVTCDNVKVDLPAVLKRSRSLAETARKSLRKKFDHDNATLIEGHAKLIGREGERFAVDVDGRIVMAERIVLDVGTRSLIPDIDGLSDVKFLDAGNWLHRDHTPDHVAVIGGGYIGLEMAQFYRRCGCHVTVIHGGEQVLDNEDRDVADALQDALADEGITFDLETHVDRIEKTDGGMTLHGKCCGKVVTCNCSDLFLAVGRKPNTHDLGLESLGIETDDQGFIEVDSKLATSVDGVFAVGDVRGGPMFTHNANDDYHILRSQWFGDGKKTLDRLVPYAVFTEPQLGRVGMTEREARGSGRKFKCATLAMEKNQQAWERGETKGLVKLIADADSDKCLGAAVLSVEGAEIVQPLLVLMDADAPLSVIRDGLPIHPTLCEALQSVIKKLD